MSNDETEMERPVRGKLTLNFDPEKVARFMATVHITKVTSGGHELFFGDDC